MAVDGIAVLIYMHPWSNGYDPGLPNRWRRFNSGRMLKNWKIMGIGVGNYFNDYYDCIKCNLSVTR